MITYKRPTTIGQKLTNYKDKTTIHSNWQVVCKLANAEIKYSYLALPMQKQKHN